jgi:hypothetical protein
MKFGKNLIKAFDVIGAAALIAGGLAFGGAFVAILAGAGHALINGLAEVAFLGIAGGFGFAPDTVGRLIWPVSYPRDRRALVDHIDDYISMKPMGACTDPLPAHLKYLIMRRELARRASPAFADAADKPASPGDAPVSITGGSGPPVQKPHL